jgi:hypothetical protein
MVKWKVALIVVLLAAVAVGLWHLFSVDEEDRIRQRFDLLAETAEKQKGEPALTSAAKAKRTQELFTDPFAVSVPSRDLEREIPLRDLPARVVGLRSAYTTLELDFTDMAVMLTSDTTAEVSTTAVLTGRIKSGERTRDIQELTCHLEKTEETWRFTAVEIVEVLKQ